MGTLQPSNHRRKKPKRRSTGVVNLDVDDVDPDGESAEEESSSVPNTTDNPGNSSAHLPPHHHHQSGHDNNKNNNNPTAATAATTNRSGSTDRSQNGEIDYRKLWEQSQLDNSKLRDDLARTRDELTTAKKKLDTVVQSPQPSSGLSDTEKKEKQALEKKLAEMEEELKVCKFAADGMLSEVHTLWENFVKLNYSFSCISQKFREIDLSQKFREI